MDNWGDIKKSINDILPKEWIKKHKYKLKEIYMTTYSFDIIQLNSLLYELGYFGMSDDITMHIFYDKSSRYGHRNDLQVISSKYLHAIYIPGYAFHPKVVLLKYSNDENKGYVVVVSSKNITLSNLMDAYAVAYGAVSGNNQENGKQLYKFMTELFDKAQLDKGALFEDLKHTDFRMSFNKESLLRFYGNNEIFNELKNAGRLLVVSPFLAQSFVEKIGDKKIDCLVSTDEGFSSLNEETASKLITDNKCRHLIEDIDTSSLHAKVYCYKKTGKVYWLIGSSNATRNGCNIKGNSGNIEYNVGFEGNENDYENFEKILSKYFASFSKLDYKIAMDTKNESDKKSDIKRIFLRFLKEICIEVNADRDKHICKVRFSTNQDFINLIHNYTMKIIANDEEYWFDSECLQICSDKLIEGVYIQIDNTEFYLDLYDMWGDEIKLEIDKQIKSNYDMLLRHLQNQILEGKANVTVPRKNNLTDCNGCIGVTKGIREGNKNYVLEKVIRMCQRENKENIKAKILELKKYSQQISMANSDDIFQKDLNSILDIVGEIYE